MSTERVAIVIGGASGIGWASAQALAADGCRIVVADRDADGAAARAAQLGAPHTSAYVDVTDEESVQRLFSDLGAIDIAVNCAGFRPRRKALSPMICFTDLPPAARMRSTTG